MTACDLPSPFRSLHALKQADVIGIVFSDSARTLLLDFCPEIADTLRVIVDQEAPTPKELLGLLMQHHGSPIAQFTFMPWRGTLQDFVTDGLLQTVTERLTSVGVVESAARVNAAWQEIAAATA